MQKVLIVNDDGYKAAGIRALIREFSQGYAVTAVAPEHEQSWMSKSISGHHDLHMTPTEYHEFKGWHVNGTPADCTQLGLHEAGHTPDFVVSGLNQGANIGHGHLLSSGTVGAALEAALQGVPAFAASVWGFHLDEGYKLKDNWDFTAPDAVEHFTVAAQITRAIVDKVMQGGFPADTQVICINVPLGATPGAEWIVTKPHTVSYGKVFDAKADGTYRNSHRSRFIEADEQPNTDIAILAAGKVSIVPITVELSSAEGRADLATKLGIELVD